ncbi:MAG: glycoside hydrolase family 57 protein [Myxococcota bacterium]
MAVKLATLLHMHQPDYRHPDSGEPVLPWVRLHAVRGYTDVATYLIETGAQATVNVVPSLLEQLLGYENGATDEWERLSRIRAEDLSDDQQAFIRARFFHGNIRMRQVSDRYQALEAAAKAGEALTAGDVRDIQVWSNLAWMGGVARRAPFIRQLFAQERGFSHDQLVALMDHQRALVNGVMGLWRQLPQISCTPYYHPILPLLVDFEHARRSLTFPAEDTVVFQWPEDALWHLKMARDGVEEMLGFRPVGLWPSEGAVSPEALRLAKEAGFEWFLTDQAQLEMADRTAPVDLYRPWAVRDGPRGLFRDRALSDKIGFEYQHWDGEAAARDLLAMADARDVGDDGTIVLALDGENPWESYPDAGEGFLTAFFRSGRCVSAAEAAAGPVAGEVTRVHTGSWINGDLGVWAGHPEDRRAWRRLAQARLAWEANGKPESARRHLAAAEGSDWFWWFGPEFITDDRALFDRLFREHLKAAWREMGLTPPVNLNTPILDAG